MCTHLTESWPTGDVRIAARGGLRRAKLLLRGNLAHFEHTFALVPALRMAVLLITEGATGGWLGVYRHMRG